MSNTGTSGARDAHSSAWRRWKPMATSRAAALTGPGSALATGTQASHDPEASGQSTPGSSAGWEGVSCRGHETGAGSKCPRRCHTSTQGTSEACVPQRTEPGRVCLPLCPRGRTSHHLGRAGPGSAAKHGRAPGESAAFCCAPNPAHPLEKARHVWVTAAWFMPCPSRDYSAGGRILGAGPLQRLFLHESREDQSSPSSNRPPGSCGSSSPRSCSSSEPHSLLLLVTLSREVHRSPEVQGHRHKAIL